MQVTQCPDRSNSTTKAISQSRHRLEICVGDCRPCFCAKAQARRPAVNVLTEQKIAIRVPTYSSKLVAIDDDSHNRSETLNFRPQNHSFQYWVSPIVLQILDWLLNHPLTAYNRNDEEKTCLALRWPNKAVSSLAFGPNSQPCYPHFMHIQRAPHLPILYSVSKAKLNTSGLSHLPAVCIFSSKRLSHVLFVL